MITNQAVRQELGKGDIKAKQTVQRLEDGKSRTMFSKREKLSSNYLLGELSKVLGIELTPLISIQKEGKEKVYTSQRDLDAPLKLKVKKLEKLIKKLVLEL